MVLPAPVVVRSREEATGRAAGNLCQDQQLVPGMNVIPAKGKSGEQTNVVKTKRKSEWKGSNYRDRRGESAMTAWKEKTIHTLACSLPLN